MSNASAKVMGCLVIAIGAAGLIILNILARAFVLAIMWGWFIVPLGAPQIGYALALGIAMTLNIFHPPSKVKDENAMNPLLSSMLMMVGTLAIGWIVHKYI